MSGHTDEIWENIRVEPVIGKGTGWCYFIACTETKRCKIGFTTGEVEKRLKALQTGAAGKLRIMAKHPGNPDTERTLHQRFSGQRIHGEWFEVNEELFAYMCATTWLMAKLWAKNGWPVEEWITAGLAMMQSEMFELPEDLAALLEAAE